MSGGGGVLLTPEGTFEDEAVDSGRGCAALMLMINAASAWFMGRKRMVMRSSKPRYRVCFANPREICLKPCNHVVVCKTCLLKMVTTPHHRLECPICRSPWTMFEHVFL